MDDSRLKKILEEVRKGSLDPDEAAAKLRDFVYGADLGFARPDFHREIRRGFPEVILGEGKTVPQIAGILARMRQAGQAVLVTRIGEDVHRTLAAKHPDAKFHPEARAVTVGWEKRGKPEPGVLVVSGGTSDLPVAEEACLVAELMGNQVERLYDVGVAGIHRLLDQKARLFQARVLVVVAGMEGALPSVVAGMVGVPVIGVPTSVGYGSSFEGLTPLLAMLNSCSLGVLVVNIDNGFGAGYAAGTINLMNKKKAN